MRFIYLCAAALLLTGCGKPVLPVVAQKTVGDLAITLTAIHPLHLGDNSFRITLADAVTHFPLNDVQLAATPEIVPGGNNDGSIRGQSEGKGVYLVSINFFRAARYDINLHMKRPHLPAADVSFPVTVK